MELAQAEQLLKASRLAGAAKRNDWHGRFDSDTVNGERVTTLEVTRNDESVIVCYTDNAYTYGEYQIFDRRHNLHCASVALEKLQSWPDLLDLFKKFPKQNRPELVAKYRRLPFHHDDPAEDIMNKLYGHQIFWYSHEYAKLDCDVVIAPKKATSKTYRIAPVAHRRIFHFIGAQAGFRSVLLDTIIKVG